MHSVRKSLLVPHTTVQMYDLVDRVEDYPTFIPWCAGARVLEVRPDGKTARLDIDYRGVKAHFTTDNSESPPNQIVITLRDGPFRHLHGEWRFRGLGEDACKVEFELAYEFANALLEKVVGPMFNYIANTFVDAFIDRADVLYAASP